MAMWSISVSSGSTWAEPATSWVASSPGMRALRGLMDQLQGSGRSRVGKARESGRASGAVRAEEGDLVLADLGAELGIVDAEAFLGGEAQHADLALVAVVVHLVGGVADLVEREDSR